MELKDVVAISGMSGLHHVTGRSKNGLIVETIGTGRKFATGFHDKVSVLEDISIYTLEGDMHLSDVFIKLNNSNNLPEAKEDIKKIRTFLIECIQLDSERVYDSDIKKLMNWFHALKSVLDFNTLGKKDEEAAVVEEVKEEVKEIAAEEVIEEKPKKTPAKKTAAKKTAAKKAKDSE
ncbi:MAG: DUF5606 domain-containing protein [Bacteroidia bacterium]